jgi:hypothetical protein
MERTALLPTPDARFAHTAFSLLIGSLAVPFVAAIAVAVAWNAAELAAGIAGGTFWVLVAATGYVVAFIALHKLRGVGVKRRTQLWLVALTATLAIVVAFVVSLGAIAGFILGAMELLAATYQVRGLLMHLIPDEPPNNSFERTREG